MNLAQGAAAVGAGTIAILAVLLGRAGLGEAHPRSPGPPWPALGQATPATQQTGLARERLYLPACDFSPAARSSSFTAHDPLARPPARHPTYLTRDQVIREARGSSPANSVVYAAFMTYADYQELPEAEPSCAVYPKRMVWVVTVHAAVWTTGSLIHGPVLKHVYSAVIDAETGMVSDSCIGCAFLSSDSSRPAATGSAVKGVHHPGAP